MAKACIVFEDSEQGVAFYFQTDRKTDCQDEPTVAEGLAMSSMRLLQLKYAQSQEAKE